MPKITKVRAANNEGSEVGQIRHNFYTGILGQIKKAEESVYYPDAFSLYKRIVKDRLESVIT